MKFSLARMLVLTAWFCLVLWFARLNGCDYQGIKDEIAKPFYSDEVSAAWWEGWHNMDKNKNPYNINSDYLRWKAYYDGTSARSFCVVVGVVGLGILLAIACCIPLQRSKFIHDWQI